MNTELNLYALQEEYIQIAQALLDSGGELTPELEAALTINKENLEVKTAKYGYVTKKFDGEILLIDQEIERLTSLKKHREKAIDQLKSKVKEAMELYGIKKIESQNIKLLLSPSKQTLIDDESLIPAKFKKKKTIVSVDKKLVKEAIESGKKVRGAHIQENNNLQIK